MMNYIRSMAQDPEEAEHEMMPRSAITTGLVDFVLPAAALAAKVLDLRQDSLPARLPERPEGLPASEEDAVHQPLRLLHARTGHDFSGYKPATVRRRIARRQRVLQAESLVAYLDVLRGHP